MNELEIVREFAAPRERVWRAWTNPQTLLQWLGPVDWPARQIDADVRVGGAWRACLQSLTTTECLWQSGRYLVLNPPGHLEFTFAWEGTNHEDGPGVETHITVLLEETSPGRTRMHFRQSGLVSQESSDGHGAGWRSCFDRMDAWLLEDLR